MTQVYGYIISVNSKQNNSIQKNIFLCVNDLMRQQIDVYWMNCNDSYLSIKHDGDFSLVLNDFQKGSFLIPYTEDYQKNVEITTLIIKNYKKSYFPYYQLMEPIIDFHGFLLKEPRIAHYDKNIIMPFASNLLVELGFQNHEFINDDDIINGNLTPEQFDIFFIGGQMGSDSEILKSLLSPEWSNCTKKIREYLTHGGNYIGICHGSGRAATKVDKPFSIPIDLKYTQLFNFLGFYLKIVDRSIYRALPGGGLINVEITDMNHPISYGLPPLITNHSYGAGPMFLEMPDTTSKSIGVIKDINQNSWNYSYWMDDSYWYTSELFSEKSKVTKINHWLNYSQGKTVWVENEYGDGKVIVFGGHPELNWNFAQYTWYDHSTTSFPVRILGNTVLYLCSSQVDNLTFHHPVDFSKINGYLDSPVWSIENDIITVSAILSNFNATYTSSWFTDYKEIDADHTLNFSFSIKKSGNYFIGFCMIDIKGYAWIQTADIYVYKDVRCQSIKTIYKGYTNEPISFSVNSSEGIPPYHYEWDFGDGDFSFQSTPIHQYSSPGCFQGNIRVIDSFQNFNISKFWVDINEQVPEFSCKLSLNPSILPAAGEIEASIIVNSSKPGNYSYLFNFGNNRIISISNNNSSCAISYIFNETLNDVIALTVENEMGDCYCLIKKLQYNNIPSINYFIPVEISTVDKMNEFRIFGIDIDGDDFYVRIDYGNGYIDTNNETIISYVRYSDSYGFYIVSYSWDQPGDYQVKAQIIDEYGFKSEWTYLFSVKIQKPTIIDIFIKFLEKLGIVSID